MKLLKKPKMFDTKAPTMSRARNINGGYFWFYFSGYP